MTRQSWRRWVLVTLVGLVSLVAGCAKQVGPGLGDGDIVPADQRVIEHVVGPGESLARIADNYYGDPDRYQDIAGDNGISDPGRIVPGSVLRLSFSADEWDAARKRAAAMIPYNKGVDLMANEDQNVMVVVDDAFFRIISRIGVLPNISPRRFCTSQTPSVLKKMICPLEKWAFLLSS